MRHPSAAGVKTGRFSRLFTSLSIQSPVGENTGPCAFSVTMWRVRSSSFVFARALVLANDVLVVFLERGAPGHARRSFPSMRSR